MSTKRKRRRISPSSSANPTDCQVTKSRHDESTEGKVSARRERRTRQQDESTRRPSHTLETLPPEVLEMILRLLPLHDVSGSIRLVSRRCSSVATTVLNGAFFVAGVRLDRAISHVEAKLPKTTTETELLTWSGAFNVLELIKSQYKMLKAVTWRYTHPPSSANYSRVCFYAGSLIDELNSIVQLARLHPGALYSNYRREEEQGQAEEIVSSAGCRRLAAFVTLCKRFMNYFEKVSECKLNRSALVSGCKAVDVLDCLAEGRQVMGFRVYSERHSVHEGQGRSTKNPSGRSRSIVTMRLRYVMRRAWFTCLQVPSAPDETSWREDQRFMYLRLRRLVGSVNEHFFEKSHYERDVLMRAKRAISHQSRPPLASTYSGYGVYAGRFFYYGNMNKYAYESKFKDFANVSSDESGHEDDEEEDGDYDDDDDESERQRRMDATHGGPPAFDLIIRVELRCSSDLAPLAIRSSLRASDLDLPSDDDTKYRNFDVHNPHPLPEPSQSSQDHSELYLKLNITCPASAANRLPGSFTWEQRCPSHNRRQKRPRFST